MTTTTAEVTAHATLARNAHRLIDGTATLLDCLMLAGVA